jgi:hypothetical protein
VLGGASDARVVGHVELHEPGAELVGGHAAAVHVAGGDPDVVAGGEETAGGLPS